MRGDDLVRDEQAEAEIGGARGGAAIDAADTLARLFDLYETRIVAFRQQPPEPDWNGAVMLVTK